MKLKKIISLTSFASLLLCSVFLVSACGNTKSDNKPTVNTNEDINSAINDLIEQQDLASTTPTSSTTTTLSTTSSSSVQSGEIKANINLDTELKDLDNTLKGADLKGFSDSDLNVN